MARILPGWRRIPASRKGGRMPRRLLLISNSTNHGQGYLDHVLPEIDTFLGPLRRLVFVPFALKDQTAYGAKARERLAAIGVEIATLTADSAGVRLAGRAEAFFT